MLEQKEYYLEEIHERSEVFTAGLDLFLARSNSVVDKLMPIKYLQLTQIAMMTQVHPHLLAQISDSFIEQLVTQLSQCSDADNL